VAVLASAKPIVGAVWFGSFFPLADPSLPRLLYAHIAVVVAAVLK